ncbi:MAG: glycoside hydrolase family 3 N-terminal domain-containing protein [Bacteroidota bacterium]|nr:glycoside hydrolase family 3 N-terminal domain-containing protein [Bacteroidota bacterium]
MIRLIIKILGSLFMLATLTVTGYCLLKYYEAEKLYSQLTPSPKILTAGNFSFRDLNKNERLDVYEDSREPVDKRVEDLLNQMTIEEKIGQMFITMIGMGRDGDLLDVPPIHKDILEDPLFEVGIYFSLETNAEMIVKRKMSHFNILHAYTPEAIARFNNNLQGKAERTRLGIPVTIATDPRHGAREDEKGVGGIYTPSFSRWPTSLGLAATRDSTLVREFGEIAREEYKACGIRLALHPMADLATEPRWARINGTFGEDAELSAAMTYSYIKGFQGDTLSSESVITMVKHFSGGGPQKDGEDAHFPYGKEQVYPGNNFDYHLMPFTKGALPAKTGQIMPYYGIPVGQTKEEVGFGFNKEIITELLRDSLKFDGVVCTDWNIINTMPLAELAGGERSWGVENLTPEQRMKKAILAGVDQIGGETSTEQIINLVQRGEIEESRIDQSVRRILRDKFTIGLFDNPFVDVSKISEKLLKPDKIKKGEIAQVKSTILLKNQNEILPLKNNFKCYLMGFRYKKQFSKYAEVVSNPEDADYIIVRKDTPYDQREGTMLESFFHQGRLYYNEEELAELKRLSKTKKIISIVNLERGAVLTELDRLSEALLVDFGTQDHLMADILFGKEKPGGKLPIELPRSQQAANKQMEDIPYDSENPLYNFGHGLGY